MCRSSPSVSSAKTDTLPDLSGLTFPGTTGTDQCTNQDIMNTLLSMQQNMVTKTDLTKKIEQLQKELVRVIDKKIQPLQKQL